MRLKLLIPLIAFSIFGRQSIGQDSIHTGSWLSVNLHYGIILPVYTEGMNVLIKAHVPAIEGDYLFKPSGNKIWQQDYHCGETGIAFFYAWMGNPAQLGNEIGVYPFINFHLQRSYREKLYLRTGIGLAYLPVTFNQETNHKNILIGTHVNTIINIRLTNHYYLSDKLRLETGFGITHCSNGSFKTPNLGINLVTINTGLSYCIDGPKKVAVKSRIDTIKYKGISHEFYAAAGISEIEPPGGSQYGAVTFSYTAYHIINAKSKIGGGIDVFYNNANKINIAADSIHLTGPIENTQVGIKAGYELTIGNLALPIEVGAYIYTKSIGHGYEYNRLGIRYYINEHFIASISLLAHFASADYVEWGLGYKL
ncbi:MAG TPA: acyloxyacyl hydrolase [Bacteroidia bacterium]|jgi:hypothetical protein|nr:acyloxyacyl hydrolase [Bacteroidia bacterium]